MTEPSRSAVVAFAGHMIDRRGAPEPRFPPHREPAIGAAIRQRLASLSAGISYSAAANGSDILFVEAMLDRGAEVNLVLPFPAADFVKTFVLVNCASPLRALAGAGVAATTRSASAMASEREGKNQATSSRSRLSARRKRVSKKPPEHSPAVKLPSQTPAGGPAG